MVIEGKLLLLVVVVVNGEGKGKGYPHNRSAPSVSTYGSNLLSNPRTNVSLPVLFLLVLRGSFVFPLSPPVIPPCFPSPAPPLSTYVETCPSFLCILSTNSCASSSSMVNNLSGNRFHSLSCREIRTNTGRLLVSPFRQSGVASMTCTRTTVRMLALFLIVK